MSTTLGGVGCAGVRVQSPAMSSTPYRAPAASCGRMPAASKWQLGLCADRRTERVARSAPIGRG
jgi:hypothetical protein